jgi:hypothetical protein
VCELGPQGWRLVAVPPIVEMKQTLGQMQAGEPLYAMELETGAQAAGQPPVPVTRTLDPALVRASRRGQPE